MTLRRRHSLHPSRRRCPTARVLHVIRQGLGASCRQPPDSSQKRNGRRPRRSWRRRCWPSRLWRRCWSCGPVDGGAGQRLPQLLRRVISFTRSQLTFAQNQPRVARQGEVVRGIAVRGAVEGAGRLVVGGSAGLHGPVEDDGSFLTGCDVSTRSHGTSRRVLYDGGRGGRDGGKGGESSARPLDFTGSRPKRSPRPGSGTTQRVGQSPVSARTST